MFSYCSEKFDKKFDIKLYDNTVYYIESYIEIISTDKEWYNSLLSKLNDILSEIENQNKICNINNIYIDCILNFILSLFESICVYRFLIKTFNLSSNDKISLTLSIYTMLIFFLINMFIFEKIKKMYPKVDFYFGPEHLNYSKKTKKIWAYCIPLIVSLIFFILIL